MKNLILILFILPALSVAGQQRLPQPPSKAEILNEKYCSPMFASAHGEYFDMQYDPAAISANAYMNVLEWLKGRLAGLQVYQTRANVSIPYIRNQLATVYVDEIPVSFDYLNMLPVSDIAMIKVIKGPFIRNWGGSGGAIAIYTQDGEDEEGSDGDGEL